MSYDFRRMDKGHHTNSLLPSINFKHIISTLLVLLLVTTTSSTQHQQQYACPSGCECNEIDLSARCENLNSLIKSYSVKQNHRNHHSSLMPIKSLDLSNNQLTKISNQLELLVNLTSLNLSHNHLTQVQKLNFEHLETLDLSHNRITSAKLSKLPRNVIHLNLTHNEITYLPVDFMKLKKLRTLELHENPLNCTCDTLMVRNWIGLQSVWSSKAIVCHAPQMFKGQPWLQARQNDICIEQLSTTTSANSEKWENFDANDIMMGDQPMDDEPEQIDEDYDNDNDGKKDEENDLEYDDGGSDVFDDDQITSKNDDNTDNNTLDDRADGDDELNKEFITVDNHHHIHAESSTAEPQSSGERIPSNEEDEQEGSGHETVPENIMENEDDGSGSGDGIIIPKLTENVSDKSEDSASEKPEESSSHKSEEVTSEVPVLEHSEIDLGLGIFEDKEPTEKLAVQKSGVDHMPKDTEQVPNVETSQAKNSEQVKTASSEDSTGTYILLAIIGILLVSLIIFVAMKNRKEKRQNRRRYDVEKNNATELQDMNRGLLGKPIEKNGNGKHAEHSPLINEFPEPKDYKPYNPPAITVDEPVQELPQKSQQSLYDNNMPNDNEGASVEPVHGNGSLPKSPDSEDEVFHPAIENHNDPETLNVEPEVPKRYSPIYSPTSPKSARYSPVYDEQGRVKIKLTETPKPKTPVIVNRTRSRAGEYINTPN